MSKDKVLPASPLDLLLGGRAPPRSERRPPAATRLPLGLCLFIWAALAAVGWATVSLVLQRI
jgi:hypothetical protein